MQRATHCVIACLHQRDKHASTPAAPTVFLHHDVAQSVVKVLPAGTVLLVFASLLVPIGSGGFRSKPADPIAEDEEGQAPGLPRCASIASEIYKFNQPSKPYMLCSWIGAGEGRRVALLLVLAKTLKLTRRVLGYVCLPSLVMLQYTHLLQV